MVVERTGRDTTGTGEKGDTTTRTRKGRTNTGIRKNLTKNGEEVVAPLRRPALPFNSQNNFATAIFFFLKKLKVNFFYMSAMLASVSFFFPQHYVIKLSLNMSYAKNHMPV